MKPVYTLLFSSNTTNMILFFLLLFFSRSSTRSLFQWTNEIRAIALISHSKWNRNKEEFSEMILKFELQINSTDWQRNTEKIQADDKNFNCFKNEFLVTRFICEKDSGRNDEKPIGTIYTKKKKANFFPYFVAFFLLLPNRKKNILSIVLASAAFSYAIVSNPT